MKIIQISDFVDISITADSLQATADSLVITADSNSSQLVSTYYIDITPRFFSTEVIATFTNELTSTITTLNCSAIKVGNYLRVSFLLDVDNSDSFSVSITDVPGTLMWRGKLFATNQEDIQQYKMNVPNQDNIIII